MKNTSELREVFLARVWLESLAAGSEANFLKRIILEAISFLLEYIEEIIGHPFYISASLDEGLQILSPPVFKKISEIGKAGFFKSLNFHKTLPDEPHVVIATAQFGELVLKSDGNKDRKPEGWSGADFENSEKAAFRCVGEAVERTCLYVYRDMDLIFGSFKELSREGAINIKEFVAFSENQLKQEKFARCRFDENSRFGWVTGKSLITGKKVLVPAQLVYLNYKYRNREPLIRQAISTGAAAYTDWEEALYRGICEVAERDAWMIHWLNELTPPMIDLENSVDEDLRKFALMFKSKNLELYVLDITTDISLPTFCAIIIDCSGLGPAVAVSTKTGFNIKTILIDSLSQGIKGRWARRNRLRDKPDLEAVKKKVETIKDIRERDLLWARPDMIPHIEFMLNGPKKDFVPAEKPATSRERLNKSLEYFRKNNLEVFAVDITIVEALKVGFRAVMVLIPKLQPLYLDENLRAFGGARLYETPVKLGYFTKPKKESELNQIPHPYL